MTRSIPLILVLALTSGAVAQETGQEATTFLHGVYSLYELPIRSGLESFEAELRVRESRDKAIKKFEDSVVVDYYWETGGGEEIEVRGMSGAFSKVIRESLKGVWRDVAGGGVFAFPTEDIQAYGEGEGEVSVVVASGEKNKHRIVFEPETRLVLRVEGKGGTVVPSYILTDGRLRLEERRVVVSRKDGEERVKSLYRYSGFRKVNGFTLPTRWAVGLEKNRVELEVEYLTINGRTAVVKEADAASVKALVKEYESGYTKLEPREKLAAMRRLEETGHEDAAKAIARRGLKDRDLEVRMASVKTLNAMRCRCVVTTLGKALKANEKNAEVYMEIIDALGDIGDPKAIPYLTKNIWSSEEDLRGNKPAAAKIDSLGRIRSKESVEALIDLMYVAKPGHMGSAGNAIRASLKKLTGQDFRGHGDARRERDLWKGWWSDNKKRFKLDEDR